MFFSYAASVVLLSLALFGLWCLLVRVWANWVEPNVVLLPPPSVVVVFRNMEQDVEFFLRLLFAETNSLEDLQLILVDQYSDDLTYAIAERLCAERGGTLLLRSKPEGFGLSVLPACQGRMIYWLDTVRRVSLAECHQLVLHLAEYYEGRQVSDRIS